MTPQIDNFRCGFVALLGFTNVGKSTLLNTLLGQKISIVSPKAQTTYHAIRGILNRPHSQIIFVDTPGFQNFDAQIPRLLNTVSARQGEDVDVQVWVFDATLENISSQWTALETRYSPLFSQAKKRFAVLNKADKIYKPKLLPMIDSLVQLKVFEEVLPISALKGIGTDSLTHRVEEHLPISPQLYSGDLITDRPEQHLVTERVREKIYELTRQELPYAVRVEITQWNEAEGKVPTIHATIHVDRESQKPILLGQKGRTIKEIGVRSRKEIQELLNKKICLLLHVDVETNWKDNHGLVRNYLEVTS